MSFKLDAKRTGICKCNARRAYNRCAAGFLRCVQRDRICRINSRRVLVYGAIERAVVPKHTARTCWPLRAGGPGRSSRASTARASRPRNSRCIAGWTSCTSRPSWSFNSRGGSSCPGRSGSPRCTGRPGRAGDACRSSNAARACGASRAGRARDANSSGRTSWASALQIRNLLSGCAAGYTRLHNLHLLCAIQSNSGWQIGYLYIAHVSGPVSGTSSILYGKPGSLPPISSGTAILVPGCWLSP